MPCAANNWRTQCGLKVQPYWNHPSRKNPHCNSAWFIGGDRKR